MKSVDLICIFGVMAVYALISHMSLCLHISKMKQAIKSEPFALEGVTRGQAHAKVLEWEAQKKRLLPMAIVFAALLCVVDRVLYAGH